MTSAAVHERPIPMSAESVRAILAGRKTQTRRVVTPQPDVVCLDGTPVRYTSITVVRPDSLETISCPDGRPDERFCDPIRCPYGQPGDRLWVRETWQLFHVMYDDYNGGYEADSWSGNVPSDKPEHCAVTYLADQTDDGPWRSPLFMPRWASRLTLVLTDVRVQRVQAITEEDAVAEGIHEVMPDSRQFLDTWADYSVRVAAQRQETFPHCATSVGAYAALWDRLNAKRGFPWNSNPWVWALTFTVEEAK